VGGTIEFVKPLEARMLQLLQQEVAQNNEDTINIMHMK
jgi:hypothetical protein